MDISNLANMVSESESEQLEFKKSTGQLRAGCETLCAFLNAHGGKVLFGVDDQGTLIGQDVSDCTKREIAREVGKIEPAQPIDIDYIDLKNDKSVIVLCGDNGNHAPYTYDGRAFQRNQSTTERMSQHRYEQLLVERGHLNYSWDAAYAPEYSIDDLDHEEIFRTVMDGVTQKRIPPSIVKENVENTLRQFNLLTDKGLGALQLRFLQMILRLVICSVG